MLYKNFLFNKSIILKENRNKAGIYKLCNKKTNKCYVGRSDNLTRRLLDYYNDNYLNNNKVLKGTYLFKIIKK